MSLIYSAFKDLTGWSGKRTVNHRFILSGIFIMLFVWGCGNDEPLPDATACTVEGIRILSFPTTDDGSAWDVSIGNDTKADPTYYISTDSLILFESDSILSNVGSGDLPTTLTPSPFLLPQLDQVYYLDLYDYDATSGDDFIGSVSFNPVDFRSERPDVIPVSNTVVSLEILVAWE